MELQEKRKTFQWVEDVNINVCYHCHKEFGFFFRKHHCRGCGKIFCDVCSKWKICFKSIKNKTIISRDEYCKFWQSTHKDIVRHRSCQNCFKSFQNLSMLYKSIKIFEFLPLSIPDLVKLKRISSIWKEAIDIVLFQFREIQYHLPLHQYSYFEKQILYVNRDILMGHNCYMKHLLLCYPYLNFNHEKSVPCSVLGCKNICQSEPSIEDILDVLLYSPSLILRGKIVKFLPKDIETFLPMLTYSLRFESKNIENSPLIKLLVTRSLQSLKIRYYFFWELIVQLEEPQYHKYYQEIMHYFLEQVSNLLGKQEYDNLLLSFDTHKNLANVNIDSIDIIKRNIIPCYPEYKITHIHRDKIVYKPSSTRPILIPIQSKKKLHKIIFKKEDVRKDRIITLIFKTMNDILKHHGEDYFILTYDVLPIVMDGGFIQIVDDCATISELNKKNLTIQNYIMQHNPNENIKTVKQRFIKSTAAYCVMTFLLGIGDRHLDNIMIKEDGRLFHIDFGFILGNDPKKFIAPLMRINPEMVDAIGGTGENYDLFKQECCKCYDILRKYPNLFFNMMFLLTKIESNITQKSLKDEIIKRFMPGETKFIADIKMDTTIKKSTEQTTSYIDILHDFKKDYINDFIGSLSSWWS
jgi:hypothetical protein